MGQGVGPHEGAKSFRKAKGIFLHMLKYSFMNTLTCRMVLFGLALTCYVPGLLAGQWGEFIYSTNATSATIDGLREDVISLEVELEVPSSIDGKPVTSIGRQAFADAALTAITIPNSVTNIGNGAFYNCTRLATIGWGHGVTTLSPALFYNCDSLTNVVLPSEIKTIEDGAFSSCSGLTNITLTAVTTINGTAFSCEKLTSVSIPSCMITMSKLAFRNCRNLLTIEVATNNLYFSSVDGVLYNKSRHHPAVNPEQH